MPSFNKVRGFFLKGFALVMKKRKVRRSIAAVLFLFLLTFFVSSEVVPSQVNFELGQVSRENIFAPRTIIYEDKIATDQKRDQAESNIPTWYIRNDEVASSVLADINTVMHSIAEIQQNGEINAEQKMDRLSEVIPFSLSEQTKSVLILADQGSLDTLTDELRNQVSDAMESQNGVNIDNIETIKENINESIGALGLAQGYIELGQGLVKHFLRPNNFIDKEKTDLLRNAARESISPVMVTIRKEERVIGAGDVVTPEHLQKLEALGLTKGGMHGRTIVGNLLLIALLMSVVLFYLYQQNPEIYRDAGLLYLLGIIVLAVLAVAKAIFVVEFTRSPDFGALMGYMVPMGAAGMLIAILLDSRLAVLVVCVMSFLLSLMAGNEIQFGVVGLVGGIAGVYSVSKLSQRGDMLKAGLYTSVASIAAIIVMGVISNISPILVVGSALILGTINGMLSSILTNGSLPYLENAFGITSSVRLLELSQPSNPLLKKLLTETPGTYHHSILVGNLAEAAAEAVGGDSLLVRVGAYYHDIGKIKRPYFFIENQLGNDNPHDKIAPSLSTLILTAHVRDGLDLAKEYKLPEAIIKIIEQHHGSSLVSYFYHKALENCNGDAINEDEFRYEGPKPQTKEAAIVMLADSVEAAVRSMQNRTHGRIEGLVRKILKEKLMDGQLDECDLTLKDLEKIAQAFVKVLSGIFHSRVEYPDLTKEIERRRFKNGGANKSNGKGTS